MAKATAILATVVASTALLLAAAGTASADVTVPTPLTFQITGGALAITAPAGPVSLGSAQTSPLAQDISSPLGNVTVTDLRGGVAGWVASAISTAFTAAAPTPAVPASALDYTTPAATVTGPATVTPSSAVGLAGANVVQTATGVTGSHTAVWNPTLTVHVPAGAQVALYSATLTQSVV
ncbi:hypothetical protein ACVGOW_25240 [Pseudonocardia saturnea]